jgi:hypothetical protein
VLAGLLVGGAASAAALALIRLPRNLISPLIPAGVALWLAVTPAHAPPSQTHSMVTQLSLKLSGHATPYTRADMLREWQQRQSTPCEPAACESAMPRSTKTRATSVGGVERPI